MVWCQAREVTMATGERGIVRGRTKPLVVCMIGWLCMREGPASEWKVGCTYNMSISHSSAPYSDRDRPSLNQPQVTCDVPCMFFLCVETAVCGIASAR